jgi:ABC-type oligopeptide transport system substrate-binding subunit
MRSRRTLSVAIALTLCVVAGACSSANTSGGDAGPATRPAQVERLRLAAGPPRYPSPITGNRVSGAQVDLMFDHLVWKDSTGEVIPWLATAWTNSADGTVTDPARFTGPQAVVGSGPYRMESYDETTGTAAYVANDSFLFGAPHVRRIEFVPAADQLLAPVWTIFRHLRLVRHHAGRVLVHLQGHRRPPGVVGCVRAVNCTATDVRTVMAC